MTNELNMHHAINEILEQLNADMDASEAHGIASGMLSVETRATPDNWLNELSGTNADVPEALAKPLLDWYEQIRLQLVDAEDEFAFDLFLPDQDDTPSEHAEALRNWCIGFLFGIGYEQTNNNWPGETGEIMRDLIEFTKLDTDIHDDEDIDALTEIHEYIRASVFIVRDHFLEAGHGTSH